jgi:DNA-binding transcriptional LysR family regulator
MTLHQLQVFAALAKIGSFTKVAESLHVRQPSVSLLIKALEREYQVKLFEKLGNKVRLSLAGEKLLQRSEEILAKVESVKEEIDEIKGLKKGRLRIGGSALAAASFLPVVIEKFKKGHQGIEVILKIQRTENLEKELLEGELDIAIAGWPPRSPLLLAEPYLEEEIVAIAPPRHPLTKKRFVSLKTLAQEPLIAPERGIRTRELLEQRFAQKAIPFVPLIEINAQTGARDTIRSAVAGGLGIGFVAKCHATGDIKAGRVKVLKVPELNLKRTMYIVIHKNRQASPLAQDFRGFLRRSKEQR